MPDAKGFLEVWSEIIWWNLCALAGPELRVDVIQALLPFLLLDAVVTLLVFRARLKCPVRWAILVGVLLLPAHVAVFDSVTMSTGLFGSRLPFFAGGLVLAFVVLLAVRNYPGAWRNIFSAALAPSGAWVLILLNGATHGTIAEESFEVRRSVRTRMSPIPHNRFELADGRTVSGIRALEQEILPGRMLHLETAHGLLGADRSLAFQVSLPCRQETKPPERIAAARAFSSGPAAGPLPLIAVIEGNYSTGFSPFFLLFEDRTVLYRAHGERELLEKAKLSDREFSELVEGLASNGELERLAPRYYVGPYMSHPPMVLISQWLADSPTRIELLGFNLRDARGVMSTTIMSSSEPESCVSPFLEGWLKNLSDFSAAKTEIWAPDYLEIRLQPYEDATHNPPLAWPKNWPGLEDRWTRFSGSASDPIRLYVPASEKKAVEAYLASRSTRQAIEFEGRMVSASVRPVFPGEWNWRGVP